MPAQRTFPRKLTPDTPPDAAQQERELLGARAEVRHWQVVGMRPDLSPEKRELVRNLERSARAEVKLRIKGLVHQRALEAQARKVEAPRMCLRPRSDQGRVAPAAADVHSVARQLTLPF